MAWTCDMEIKWLEDFLCLAETRNFSRAAALRHVTQPAFSRRIKLLEDWFGADLVDRNTFPTTLTLEGRAFRGIAEETLRLLGTARDEVREAQRRSQSVLRFAALHTLAVTFYPEVHRQLQGHFGNLCTKVRALDIAHCVEALDEGACDLFLGYGHADVPVLLDPSEFPYRVLGYDAFVAVSVSGPGGEPVFPWPGTAERRARLLGFAANCFLGRLQERFLRRAEPVRFVDLVYENSMADAVKAMVLDGHGMGWLPLSLIRRELADGQLVQAARADWSTDLEIRLYRNRHANRAIVEQAWAAIMPIGRQ